MGEIKQQIVLSKIKSSNIEAIGWENDILYLLFPGKSLYEYYLVKEEIYLALKEAKSIGSYFYNNIRNNKQIKYRKVDLTKVNLLINEIR